MNQFRRTLNEALEEKAEILELARQENIYLTEERLYSAIQNFQVANWQAYTKKPEMVLITDSISYGCEQAELYMQQCAIFRQEMEENE